jgi:streptomycin 6-kinase
MSEPALRADLKVRWALRGEILIADTPRSLVFRAFDAKGKSFIAKVLKPNGMEEVLGFNYLAWRGGKGAINLIEAVSDAGLLEDGGNIRLTDIVSEQGDEAAAIIISDVLAQLHAPSPLRLPAKPTPLEQLFEPLFEHAASFPDPKTRTALGRAADFARNLLATQVDIQPLHGDIHHDNILSRDGKTWRAIDPKSYLGDPVYDVANLFGNPLGATELILSPERIKRLCHQFAGTFGCEPAKVLRFAAAHAGLSVCWSLPRVINDPSELENVQERLALLAIAADMIDEHSV